MSVPSFVAKVARVVSDSYKIIATTILGYILVTETVRRERARKKYEREQRERTADGWEEDNDDVPK